jgi:hypothetical protein
MEKMQIFLSSKTIELSERKNYLELLNRVCYYGAPNGNMVELPYDESTLEKAKTLEGMPVYGKYTTTPDGKPTFKGHEVSLDANGEIVLNTIPIGVHMSIEIKDDAVEIANGSTVVLPCLFARQKIWKRNKFACAAVKRLFEEGQLHNSWEIETYEYAFKDGIKRLLDYIFDGNCFLGPEYASPAYGDSAEVISLSSKQSEMLVAEALAKDVFATGKTQNGNEVDKMQEEVEKDLDTFEEEVDTGGVEIGKEKGEEATAATSTEEAGERQGKEVVEPAAEPESAPAQAELTMRDLRWKIEEALYKFADKYLDVVYIFPESHIGWAHDWQENETDMHEFTYSVENNKVTILSISPITLVVSPRQINSAIEEKASALIEAQKQIDTLLSEIEELKPFKSAAEQAAREKAEAERKEAIASLRSYAEESGMVSKEELASGEIAEMIESLNETGIKVLIADRIVEKGKKSKPAPEVAQKQPKVRTILTDNAPADSYAVLKDFLRK